MPGRPGSAIRASCWCVPSLDAGYEVSTGAWTGRPGRRPRQQRAADHPVRVRGVPAAQRAERRKRLAEIAAERRTVVLYEAPHRVVRTIADLAEACGPDRPVAVARELTKLYETVVRGTLGDVELGEPRGEYVDRARRGAADRRRGRRRRDRRSVSMPSWPPARRPATPPPGSPTTLGVPGGGPTTSPWPGAQATADCAIRVFGAGDLGV